MKYCSKCGSELQDDAQFCPNCGAQQDVAKKTTYTTVIDGNDESGKTDTYGILGLVFSILGGFLGLIFDIVALTSSNSSEKGKKYGKIGLIIFIVEISLLILLWILLVVGASAAAAAAAY